MIFHPRQCKIRAGPSASRFGRGRAFCIVDSGRSLRFVIGRAPAWPRAARELHNLYFEQRSARNERHYSRRRRRHTALPADHGHQQTAAAGLRQAHDLLPSVHPDAGRIQDILIISTPEDTPRFEHLLGTAASTASACSTRCSPPPTGWPRRSSWGRSSPAGTAAP